MALRFLYNKITPQVILHLEMITIYFHTNFISQDTASSTMLLTITRLKLMDSLCKSIL
jgi:hypothetical protein